MVVSVLFKSIVQIYSWKRGLFFIPDSHCQGYPNRQLIFTMQMQVKDKVCNLVAQGDSWKWATVTRPMIETSGLESQTRVDGSVIRQGKTNQVRQRKWGAKESQEMSALNLSASMSKGKIGGN
jgi:hypothetical protein